MVMSLSSRQYEINHAELEFREMVGEGSFGIVRRAVWRGMDVAVKQLKVAAVRRGVVCLQRRAPASARGPRSCAMQTLTASV
jgi:hypothetical protein